MKSVAAFGTIVVAATTIVALLQLTDGVAATEEFRGIGSSRNTRNIATTYDEHLHVDFVPPWRDTIPTSPPVASVTDALPIVLPAEPSTGSPTGPPTRRPTENPTKSPTATTAAPTANDVVTNTTVPPPPSEGDTSRPLRTTAYDEETGVIESSCVTIPKEGNLVTEVLEIEYFLYLDDKGVVIDEEDLQRIVESSLEPRLHGSLVELGMECESWEFVFTPNVMVSLSSSGNDLVGAQCSMDGIDELLLANNATSCYQVFGQIEATMWFSPKRRKLQEQSSTLTPFGDREAFNLFTNWMEEAFDSLSLVYASDDSATPIVKVSFQGFLSVNEFDGTNLERPSDVVGNIDSTAALLGSSLKAEDGGRSMVVGLIAIICGVMVLGLVVLVVVVKRRNRKRAYLKHAMNVDNLQLDSKYDPNISRVVDDDSLFRGDDPSLPSAFKVQLEGADHDCRWIGEEKAEKPVFVATEKNKEFRDHLRTLKRRKEEEVRAAQYEFVML